MKRRTDYKNIPQWKKELTRKIGLFGLTDLRRLAPIGDLGYADGWYFGDGSWMDGGMERAIMEAFHEQGFKADSGETRWNCDHHYYNKELGLRWAVDSGD